jgi:hypothetical protein
MQALARTLVMAMGGLLFVVPPASAQREAQEEADAKTIASYRLTLSALRKYEAIADHLSTWLKTQPAAQVEQAGASASSSNDDMSIDEMAKEVVKVKAVADALQKAGMTSREYVIFTFALAEAGLYVEMKKRGLADDPEDTNPANIKFVEDNAAVLKALQTKVESVNKGLERVRKAGS